MKVLIVTNMYPPSVSGGYELACRDVAVGLHEHGFQILVLTTLSEQAEEPGPELARILPLASEGRAASVMRIFSSGTRSLRHVQKITGQFQPDVVYFWNLVGLPLDVIAWLSRSFPSVVYVAEFWFRDWMTGRRAPDRGVNLILQLQRMKAESNSRARFLAYSFGRWTARRNWDSWISSFPSMVQFVSAFMQKDAENHGIYPLISRVIPLGIDHHLFPFEIQRPARATKLLYVGRLVPSKGVETAIRAIGFVRKTLPDAVLTLVGTGPAAFLRKLERLIKDEQIPPSSIHFEGMVSRENLSAFYNSHDMLIFPSEWDEPFPLVLLEAMSSGIPILSSGTGGSMEAAGDSEVVVFEPGNARILADKVIELSSDWKRREQLARNGLVKAKDYSKERMILSILEDFELISRSNEML
ncbi:MAG: glycosyltransferase family 4 protein [Actinobacteria bacterium]|nr:glycosyltransferase family 4 protein [Actinomycetota bacterium]